MPLMPVHAARPPSLRRIRTQSILLPKRSSHPLCLQGGIVYSNVITTVSPTYARESVAGGAAGWLNSTLARCAVTRQACFSWGPFPDSDCSRPAVSQAVGM